MKSILVVDDNSVCLSLAKSMLSDCYNVFAVLSGELALKFLEKRTADLILLDINMPDQDGFETLKKIKENPTTKDIPIIFLTSDTDPETERKCFEMGAHDFIVKPFQKATIKSRVSRTIDLIDLQNNLETELLEKTKQIARISLKSMMMIANTVDKKDPFASNHSTNVARFSVEIAKKLGWSSEEIYNLQNLALVHDIGNIGVPDKIIRKNGPLTPDEYEAVKRHTTVGKNILEDLTVIRKAAEIAETHHERFDGKGYPQGLSGEAIPIESRIIAVADAFDSMTSDRSYRKKLTDDELLDEFAKGRGTQFDPAVADIAIEIIKSGGIGEDSAAEDHEDELAIESSKLLQRVLKEYSKEVRSESQRDALTGLWNRNFVSDFLNDYLTDKRNGGCLLMIDIDGFKAINDTCGHIIGDRVIQSVSESIRSLMRQDDIVSRLGGDEFMVFLKGNSSRSFASAKAEEIILALDKAQTSGSYGKPISVSIGISVAPFDGSDFAMLYSKADKALYHAKENGKHTYHFFSEETRPVRNNGKSTRIDLEFLHHFIEEQSDQAGAYEVEYENFKKIYRFMVRAKKRTGKPVVIILMTITDDQGEAPASDILDDALIDLKKSIMTAIRSGDLTTSYSSSQYLIMLVGSTSANGYLVAERIRKSFYDTTQYNSLRLTYDVDTMQGGTDE